MSTSRPQDISGDDDLIDRWLDEGDRLSETARASAAAAPVRKRRRLAEAVAELGAKAERRRFTVVVGAVALATVSILGLRAWSHAVLRNAPAVAEDPPRAATAIAVPAAPAPAPEAAPAAAPPPAPAAPTVAVAAPQGEAEPQPLPAAVATSAPQARPVALAAPPEEPEPVPVAVVTPSTEARPATVTAPAGVTVPAGEPAPITAAPRPAPAAPDALSACRAALRRERARDALAACDKVARERPASADALVLLARANLLAGWDSETLRLARRASFLDPACADAYLLIGSVDQAAGQTSAARGAYETYLRLAPRGAHADELRAILPKL